VILRTILKNFTAGSKTALTFISLVSDLDSIEDDWWIWCIRFSF